MPYVFGEDGIDASGFRVAVVVSMFNDQITTALCDGALETAQEMGVADDDLAVFWVPGAYEIPQITLRLAESGEFDAIACVGAVVRGETPHFDYIAGETSRAIMDVALGTGTPVAFGVITADTLQQAEARAGGDVGNKGSEAMYAALHMASLFRQITVPDDTLGGDD